MTPKQAEAPLREIIEPMLRPHGFRRSGTLAFVREHQGAFERIGFSVFKDRNGKLRFSYGVGVWFGEIESLRGNSDSSEDTPTIGVPMHFLRSPRKYFDWELSAPTQPGEIEGNVREELQERALPFLRQYSSIDALRTALEKDDPHSWFTLDSEQRDELLTLIDLLQRGKEVAIQRLDAALARRASALPKTRYPLEKLRARLSQES